MRLNGNSVRAAETHLSAKFIVDILTLCLCIIVVIVMPNVIGEKVTSNNPQNGVCRTNECGNIAREIASHIDNDTNPCENFFTHVCGKNNEHVFRNHFPMPISYSNPHKHFALFYGDILLSDYSAPFKKDLAIRKAVVFYKSCLRAGENNDRKDVRDRMEYLLTKTGYYPMIGLYSQLPDFGELHETYANETGLSSIFTVNSDYPSLHLGKPRISIEIPHGHLKQTQHENPYIVTSWFAIYDVYIRRIRWRLSYFMKMHGNLREEQDNIHVHRMIDFEEKLFNINMNRRNESQQAITIRDLQTKWNSATQWNLKLRMDWLDVIRKRVEGSDLQIDDDTIVIVSPKNLIEHLGELLQNSEYNGFMDYINWIPMLDLLKDIGEHFKTTQQKIFDDDINEQKSLPRCMTEGLKHATHAFYLRKNRFHNETRMIDEMRGLIIAEIQRKMHGAMWLGFELKEKLSEVLQNIKLSVDCHNWYNGTAAIDKYYEELHIGEKYLENIVAVRKFRQKKGFVELKRRQEREHSVFQLPPSGYVELDDDDLPFPIGNQPPTVFNTEWPGAVNYGRGGVSIAQEASYILLKNFEYIHHDWISDVSDIDRSSIQFVAQEIYKLKLQDLFNRFSTLDVSGRTVTARAVELIANAEAIRVAFEAYQTSKFRGVTTKPDTLDLEFFNVTDRQLFFYACANQWCKEESLKNSALNNLSISFAETFQCRNVASIAPIGIFN